MQETSSLCKWEKFFIILWYKKKLNLHCTLQSAIFHLENSWKLNEQCFSFSLLALKRYFSVSINDSSFFTPWSLVYVPKWNWNVVNNCISTICTSMWFHYILHFSSLWQVTSSTGHSSQSSDSYRWGSPRGILSRVFALKILCNLHNFETGIKSQKCPAFFQEGLGENILRERVH